MTPRQADEPSHWREPHEPTKPDLQPGQMIQFKTPDGERVYTMKVWEVIDEGVKGEVQTPNGSL